MSKLSNKPFIVIDLGAGKYVQSKTGHEVFNLEENPTDGRYYGYCPDYDNIDIKNLGAKATDSFIENVIVIYTTKALPCNNRRIIAFTDCATIHRTKVSDKKILKRLKRTIIENGKTIYCTYTIESDSLYNLKSYPQEFIIEVNKNSNKFRRQRFYKGKYPKLDEEIISYLETYLENKELIEDGLYQDEIQNTGKPVKGKLKKTSDLEPQMTKAGGSTAVRKNPAYAKQALVDCDYLCQGDSKHKTFMTNKGVPYMEGHHLIPCTATYASTFWNKYRKSIDCVENIVCLCPTCHRRIHFGSEDEKRKIIKLLFSKQEQKLASAGIKITEDELTNLYLK